MANRAYLGPRLGRRDPPRRRGAPIVTPGQISTLVLWFRADLGYNGGTKKWTCQKTGKTATSGGAPTQTTEASLNGQTVLQCAAGGADSFQLDAANSYGVITPPFVWLGVFRITSGTAQYNIQYSTDGRSQFMVTPTTTALYCSTLSDGQVSTSTTTDLGTTPHVAMFSTVANIARLDGTSLTHAQMNNFAGINNPEAYFGYTVNAHQIAEIILANNVDDLMILAPYIKSRYGLTL